MILWSSWYSVQCVRNPFQSAECGIIFIRLMLFNITTGMRFLEICNLRVVGRLLDFISGSCCLTAHTVSLSVGFFNFGNLQLF